ARDHRFHRGGLPGERRAAATHGRLQRWILGRPGLCQRDRARVPSGRALLLRSRIPLEGAGEGGPGARRDQRLEEGARQGACAPADEAEPSFSPPSPNRLTALLTSPERGRDLQDLCCGTEARGPGCGIISL